MADPSATTAAPAQVTGEHGSAPSASAPSSSASSAPQLPAAFCNYCEDRPATVWCEACCMKLCAPNGCDAELHATRGRTDHVREPYPFVKFPVVAGDDELAGPQAASAVATMCAGCESHIAAVHCQECEMDLCAPGCDNELHAAKGKAGHQRTPIGQQTAASSASAAIPAANAAASVAALQPVSVTDTLSSSSSSSAVAPSSSPAPSASPIGCCDQCESVPATLYCDECILLLCAADDAVVHAAEGPKGAHARVNYPIKIGENTSAPSKRSGVPATTTASKAALEAAQAHAAASPAAAATPSSPSDDLAAPSALPPPMCSFCESHLAEVRCDECAPGQQLTCAECDRELHARKANKAHSRRLYAPASASAPAADAAAPAVESARAEPTTPAAAPFCDWCSSHVADVRCDMCKMNLCTPHCDEEVHNVHNKKDRDPHVRQPLRPAADAAPAASSVAEATSASASPIVAAVAVPFLTVASPSLSATITSSARASPLITPMPAASSASRIGGGSAGSATCDRCEIDSAQVYCDSCVMILCPSCDEEIHTTAGSGLTEKSAHERVGYPIAPGAAPGKSGAPDAQASAQATPAAREASRAHAAGSPMQSGAPAAAPDVPTLPALEDDELAGLDEELAGASTANAARTENLPSLPASSTRPSSSSTQRATSGGGIELPASSNSRPPTASRSSRPPTADASGTAAPAVVSSSSSSAATAAKASPRVASASPKPAATRVGSSGPSSVAATKRAASITPSPAATARKNSIVSPSSSVSSPRARNSSMADRNGSASGAGRVFSREIARKSTLSSSSSLGDPSPPLDAAAARERDPLLHLTPSQALLLSNASPTGGAPSSSSSSSSGAESKNYNIVLYTLRTKVAKLEELLDESHARVARLEVDNKSLSDNLAKETRMHRDSHAEAVRERNENASLLARLARMESERDEWKNKYLQAHASTDDLVKKNVASQAKAAETIASLEKQILFHASASSDKSSELSLLRSELATVQASASEMKSALAAEREVNAKYRLYSSQYEGLIVTLREKLGESERRALTAAKWKAKASSFAEEWDAERKRMKKKISRQGDMVEELRRDLRDYRAILKYVAVRGFVSQFLLRKSLRRLMVTATELATLNLIEQTEASSNPRVHSSVQLDQGEELQVRNNQVLASWPWGKGQPPAAAVAAGSTVASGGADATTADASKRTGSGGGGTSSSQQRFPPLTACVHSILGQLHILSESGSLIRAQKRRWQSTADSFFKRNIELTNSFLLSDAELLQSKKKAQALRQHTRNLQASFHEKESALHAALAEKSRLHSELDSLERSTARGKQNENMLAQAKFERSVELTRRVAALEGELKSLQMQRDRLAGEVDAAAVMAHHAAALEAASGGEGHTDSSFSAAASSTMVKQQARDQSHLLSWHVRETALGIVDPTRGMVTNTPAPRARSPARVPGQKVHRAIVPAPRPPVELFEDESAANGNDGKEEEKNQSTPFAQHQPPSSSSSMQPHAGGLQSLSFDSVPRPVTATSSSSVFTPGQPLPQIASVVRSGAGRPVSSPSLGGWNPDLVLAVASSAAAMSKASVDPYRGDAFSRGESGTTATPAYLLPQQQYPASARSASRGGGSHYPHFADVYHTPQQHSGSPATAHRPASSSMGRSGGARRSPSREYPSPAAPLLAQQGHTHSPSSGVMPVPSKKRAAVGAGAAEALNRTILDAAMARAARRRGSGQGLGQGPRVHPAAGSRAAILQAQAAAQRKGDAGTQSQERPSTSPAGQAGVGPTPPPVASLKASLLQPQQ